MVKNQISIIVLVGIVIMLTATSGCISGDEDSNQASDTSYNSENTDSSLNTETQDQSSSQSSSNICPECNGAGTVECYNTVTGGATCDGTGIVQGGGTEGSTCRVCGGSGTITCPTCGGSGTV